MGFEKVENDITSLKPSQETGNLNKLYYLHAPQIGVPILSWHLKQYNSVSRLRQRWSSSLLTEVKKLALFKTIHYLQKSHNTPPLPPKNLHRHCF